MERSICSVLLLLCMLGAVELYPGGPPVSQCGNMTPNHGAAANSGMVPYTMTVSQSCYKPGINIWVEINGTLATTKFRGFFVQARKGSDATASYGTFSTMAQYQQYQQQLSCFSGSNNAIGHSNSNKHDLASTKFMWQPGQNDMNNITFTATIVQIKVVFWTQVTADLTYDPNCAQEVTTTSTAAPGNSATTPVNAAATVYCSLGLLVVAVVAVFSLGINSRY